MALVGGAVLGGAGHWAVLSRSCGRAVAAPLFGAAAYSSVPAVSNRDGQQREALTRRRGRTPQFVRQHLPPRTEKMAVDQDWTSVYPTAAVFKPASVPLPVRMGYPVKRGVPPPKEGNLELMKLKKYEDLLCELKLLQAKQLKILLLKRNLNWKIRGNGISTESQKIKHRNRIHSGFSSDVQATLIEVLNPLAAQPSYRKRSTLPASRKKINSIPAETRTGGFHQGHSVVRHRLCLVFTFSWREDIRPGDPQHTKKFCFDAISHSSPVTLYDCHGMKGNQLWRYRKDKTLFHPVSSSCMDCSESDRKIFMNSCNPSSPTQQWIFEHTNSTVLEKFNRNLDL